MNEADAGRERPWADAGREADAIEMFPYRTSSVEEYAARRGHGWICFSFDDYRYRDEVLDRWIAALGAILRTPGRLAQCQEKWLSTAELAQVRAEEAEPL